LVFTDRRWDSVESQKTQTSCRNISHILQKIFKIFFPKTLSFCFVILFSVYCEPGLIHILVILLLVCVDYYRLCSIIFIVYHRMLSIPVVTRVTHSITYHYQYCLCACRSPQSLDSVIIIVQMCCETHLKCMIRSTLIHWCHL
jgi:hypothetical protein